jgi:hypothetical protein
MKTYEIKFHCRAFVKIDVEAENEKEAEEKARAAAKTDLEVEHHTIELDTLEEVTELIFES